MKDDILKDVSRETIELLKQLRVLVEKWNKSINLISKSTVPEIWSRHILDSAQIFYARNKRFKRWLDIGSGAGFPGLVVSILAQDNNINGEIVLVDSDTRKCAFLSTVKRELSLNLYIINNRIELCERQEADVISARALTDLSNLLELSFNHMNDDSTLIFAKGKSWREELFVAQKTWNFSWEAVTSITDPKSVVLKIGELSRAN